MPWRPLREICREVAKRPLRLAPTAATDFTDDLVRLGINPSEIPLAALEAAPFTIPGHLEAVMYHGAREMKWIVSGRRSPDGKREVIHPNHWAFLTLDIEHQVARDLDGKLVYADLKGVLYKNDLTEEEWESVEDQLAPPSPAPVSKAGTTVPTDDTTARGDQLQQAPELPESAIAAFGGSRVGRRPASQSQDKKIWKAFDERKNAFTFDWGELTRIAGEIGEETGYKQNTVEKIIRDTYRDLERKKKQDSI